MSENTKQYFKSCGSNAEWNWHPDLPVKVSPLFDWPTRPAAILQWFRASWLPFTEFMLYVVIALGVWWFLIPPFEEMRSFSKGWVLEVWLRNLLLMIAVAAGLHLWLYTWRKQGDTLKYDRRGLADNNRTFTFNSQLWDNVFWSLGSGVTIWTAYECLVLWGYANGLAPMVTWDSNPVWFIVAFLLVPVWQSFHFYWVHRLLHWPPLYRVAHALHHRNVSVGPWSGFSMHPIEHVLYLSGFLILFVVPAHPLHMLFYAYWLTLGTATSHSGYEALILGEQTRFKIGGFFHQLHHRYFECNYGNVEMPWDRWFGSHHDGSPEATARVKERRRQIFGEG